MNKIVRYLTILLVLCSCANQAPKVEFETVDVNVLNREDSPDIDPESKIGEYGPIGVVQESIKKEPQSLGIIFGPGLYAALAGLEVLSCLKRSEVKFQVVGGFGFSTIITSMFSMGLSIEKIKWLMATGESSNVHQPYSREWVSEWKKFVKNHVNLKMIKLSEISLWLPSADDSPVFESKYEFDKAIARNIEISDRDFILKKRINYKKATSNIPVDRILVLNFLSSEMQTNRLSEFAKGLMRKTLSYVPVEETNRFLIYNLDIIKIDDMSSIQINDFNEVCDQIKSKIE